jgi:DNA-binding response OmpR family regulator
MLPGVLWSSHPPYKPKETLWKRPNARPVRICILSTYSTRYYNEAYITVLLQSMAIMAGVIAVIPTTWRAIQDTYYLFFMTDTTTAVCLTVYIVITLLFIVFLLQPKAARTWVRPRRSKTGAPSAKLQSQAEIADICGTPIIPVGSPGKESHPIEAVQQASAAPRTMPPLPRSERVSVHHAPVARSAAAVLYITDNDSSSHLLDSLGAAGMAVISALPGKESIRNISVTKFDIIVIDTLIAEAARLCATRILEALPPKPQMPVLIIINHPGQTLNMAATNARIEYIFRPFDDGFLVARVGMMLTHGAGAGVSGAQTPMAPSMPYDRHMERLVESLPSVADGIQQKSEQESLTSIELHSGIIAAFGEESGSTLSEKLKTEEPPLAEEIKKTAEQVDELLRLCATVKPPKAQK